ncbi:caspase family protein [Seohaeicola nanhaiensis]|uniref:Caspase family protein n=1 Tax=Seohaeicola nanhaiensis TaxID=1387282 RepID=A0ABV9KDH4_9RHOB
MRILSFLTTVSLFLATAALANVEKRVALVIGNSAYANVEPLTNPKNDAVEMSRQLKDLGFLTVEGTDLDQKGFQDKIREFARLSIDADLTLFFYAGHGMAVNGVNYLIPVDARMEDATALDWEAVSVDFITKQMQRSDGVSLIFLDACRNNPLARTLTRSMGKLARSTDVSNGLARMDISNPGRGMAVAFATSPGEVALDGEGKHSPFTEALLANIAAPNRDITEVMSRVTGQVYDTTKQAQRPWLNSSLTGRVILNPVGNPEVAPSEQIALGTEETPAATGGTDLAAQRMLFQMARDSNRIEDYQAYITTFPEGLFVTMAKNSIETLEKEKMQTQVASLTPQGTVVPYVQQPQAVQPQVQATGPVLFAVPTPQTIAPQGTVMTRAIDPTAPQVTPEMRTQPASEFTEQAMGMNGILRREVQARLNLAGFNVGTPDGSFGPRTRSGIQGWQASIGLVPSGYLNHLQYSYLAAVTAQQYAVWAAANPPRQASSGGGGSTTVRRTNTTTSNGNGAAIGAFLGGMAAGMAIKR